MQSAYLKKIISKKYYLLIFSLLFTGFGAALTAILFRSGVHNLEEIRLAVLEIFPPTFVLPILGALGGLISGTLVSKFSPASSGSGITHLVGYLHDRNIPINLKVGIIKLVSGVIAIGSGFPLGAEGPSVQMGSSVAWQISKWLKAPKSLTKIIVSAGGGAGLAAVFGAPIAGFLFVVEELLYKSKPILIAIAAITAFMANSWGAILNSLGFDNESIRFSGIDGFVLDPHHNPIVKFIPLDIIYLVILGIIVAIVGEIYTVYLLNFQKKAKEIFKNRYVLKMTFIGALIGIIYSILPEIFHEFTELDNLIIDGEATGILAFQTFLVMFLTTGLSVAAGAPGGLFMPMITLGASIGLALNSLMIFSTGYAPTTLVFAGMAAFISSCSRTPLTAIFIVLALTHNNLILTPVLIGSITSYLFSKCLNEESIYERQLEDKLMGEK
tara:strand:+ start:3128 stop:4450 length:1323 start_codon:yes stop_codon:yes gene_type:complete